MAKTIHPKANQFIQNGGLLPVGAYDDIIKNPSTLNWDEQGLLIKKRRNQRKTWIFFGAYAEDLMLGMAIVDAGYIGNAFSYFYVPSEDIFIEDKVLLPMAFGQTFDPKLTDSWNLKNHNIYTTDNKLIGDVKGKFELHFEAEHNSNGLSFMCPSKERPFNFTYKNLSLPVKAKVKYKEKTYELEGNYGGIDFSKGFPPRSTFWNWASVVGKTSSGLDVGMNLFRGHNGKYENAAWIGVERILLNHTTFTYDDKIPLDNQECLLQTEDGLVDLKFTPSGKRSEKINAGLISHDFVQAFGKFEGSVQHNNEAISVIGYGPLEKHYSKW